VWSRPTQRRGLPRRLARGRVVRAERLRNGLGRQGTGPTARRRPPAQPRTRASGARCGKPRSGVRRGQSRPAARHPTASLSPR
jgi:hypothetical protein